MVDELGIVRFGTGVHELHDNPFVPFGNEASHLGGRILVAHQFGQFQQPGQIFPIPGRGVLPPLCHLLDFLPGIVDKGAELRLLRLRQPHAKDVLHLFPYDPGTVVQDVEKGRILSVQIAHEMLNALGQLQLGLQVDKLLINHFLGRIFFRQQAHYLAGTAAVFLCAGHDHVLPCVLFQVLF